MNLGCPKKEIIEIDRVSWELGVIQICVAMIHFLSHDCSMKYELEPGICPLEAYKKLDVL